MIYFVIIFANEVLSVASKKAMKGQILWHKVKRKHMRTILHMAKENDRKQSDLVLSLSLSFSFSFMLVQLITFFLSSCSTLLFLFFSQMAIDC